jgi:hypothetical protein
MLVIMENDIRNAAPVMDVAPPPASPAPIEELPSEPQNQPDQQANKPSKPPKAGRSDEPKSGVALAIVATVIIVLGLAAMATYAYMKQ